MVTFYAWQKPACKITLSCLALLLVTVLVPAIGGTQDKPKSFIKTEHFDRDPNWQGFNNHIVLKQVPNVTQNFGYSPTTFAGDTKGEIGGRVHRSSIPAYYAEQIAVKTLNDKLTASGSFAFTATTGGSGVFFGWFNSHQPGGGNRPMNSLGLDFDAEGTGSRLAVRLITSANKSCGTFVTPFISGVYRPTPIKNDGTRYHWSLSYDLAANSGNGQIQFTIKSNSAEPEEFEGKVFTVDLPAGLKQEGASFDRFGLMNFMKPGSALTIYFSDLELDGKTVNLTRDPDWIGSGNHNVYQDPEHVGAHNFGFSAQTNFAGGSPGEIGGSFWRTEKGWGYYADQIGALTLDDRLEARGKVVLKVGAPDSGMYLGWFNHAAQDTTPASAGNFLGIYIEGPTSIGHYFRPVYATANGTRAAIDHGPILLPDKVYQWSLSYDPTVADGLGAIRVTLDDESVTLTLKKDNKTLDVQFDRFGLLTANPGGSLVKIFFDDLQYTSARPAP